MIESSKIYCIPYFLAKKPTPIIANCSNSCKVCTSPSNPEEKNWKDHDMLSEFRPNFKPKTSSTRIAEQYLSFNKNLIIDETDNDDDTIKADQNTANQDFSRINRSSSIKPSKLKAVS